MFRGASPEFMLNPVTLSRGHRVSGPVVELGTPCFAERRVFFRRLNGASERGHGARTPVLMPTPSILGSFCERSRGLTPYSIKTPLSSKMCQKH